MPPIPITIITGFLGSGKTTLILNLIPQLPKDYRLALLKNEFGDLAIDSQLASSASIGGVQELLNGCICCNLVGQLGDALDTLRKDVKPDRIMIETNGSAFPATLAMEVNRLARESGNYVLDGVVVVIDVENWQGYEDTSYTAKMQAQYTDLIVFNKWENVSERRYEDCLDRVGDLDLQVANVKSAKGRVDLGLLLGLDSALARKIDKTPNPDHHDHSHASTHQSEVEVLSITIQSSSDQNPAINLDSLETFLLSAPKDEIYRIKAIMTASNPPTASDGSSPSDLEHPSGELRCYILNWAFGRWTFTPSEAISKNDLPSPKAQSIQEDSTSGQTESCLRMTIILAKYEAEKWKKRLQAGDVLKTGKESNDNILRVERLS